MTHSFPTRRASDLPSGGSVTVQGRYDAGKGAALLVISDTGVGIAPEDIPVALAPYGQVGLRNTRKNKGTGLGLPLTKRLVEALGAAFELNRKVGVGTVVTLWFQHALVVTSRPPEGAKSTGAPTHATGTAP